MLSPLTRFFEELIALSVPEMAAVVLAIAYLLLAIRQNIWCWLCAGLSTAIYIGLFIDARLYMESALNVFYFGMAVYGWRTWRAGAGNRHEMPVTEWPLRVHVTALGVIAILVAMTGTLLSRYTDAAFPFIDSATTFSAVWATFLVARKVLENWWYWLVIDVVSIFIYWSRGLEFTAALFIVYCIMIPFGLVAWARSMRVQQASPA